MAGQNSIDTAELRSAAHAEDSLANDLKPETEKLLTVSREAASSFDGWSIATSLHTIAESWRPPLEGLHARITNGAENLRRSADGYDWNEDSVSRDFESGNCNATAANMTLLPGSGITSRDPARISTPVNSTAPDPGFAGANPALTGVTHQPSRQSVESHSLEDMQNAKSAMPVYERKNAADPKGEEIHVLRQGDPESPFG